MRSFALASSLLIGTIPSVLAANIDVVVGGPGILKFNPPSVNANIGDVVRFIFQQKNHTVTQSTLDQPCQPLANGFDTGFVPVADATTSGFPVAELTVTRTTPVWAYCKQGNHCQQGMVFAINPADKLAAFQQAATGGASPSPSATGSVTIQPVSTTASSTATSPASASSSAASSRDHKIVVGGPGVLTFSPANITAQVGDTITFEFHEKNHTATASSFDSPCRDLFSSTGTAGFDSGFQPVASGATNFPTYTVQVNDTKPIWAYCKQATHCGSGMVFAANALESSSKSFEAFKALAMQQNGTGSGSSGSGSGYGSGARSVGVPVYAAASIAVTSIISSWFL
ncbi:hypothetical protein CPB83DRAFT_847601 [Crepidotus variabilis]|uniref:Cupredoxin n=1 Tax=Crepidotus variabilis TaxID=179855 RepID=A0A9P6JTU8_9AGAR|nr:hypothetical protein CPB83DRAFT_847601 [Crepidotus variabilis]